MPVMMFIGNLNYVVVAVLGGLRVASGSMSLGDVQAFIQYSRQFTQPLTQLASMVNLLQSGVASAERVFELLDAEEEPAVPVAADPPAPVARGEVVFEHVSFSYDPDAAADRGPVARRARRARRSPSSGRPAPARRRWSTSSCGSTTSTPGGSRSTASTSPRCAVPTCAARSAWCCRTRGCSRGRSATTSATAGPDASRGRDPRGGPGHLRRPLRAHAARRLRHRHRRGRLEHLAPASGSWSRSRARSCPTRRC